MICLAGEGACIMLVGQWNGVKQEFKTLSEGRVLPNDQLT